MVPLCGALLLLLDHLIPQLYLILDGTTEEVARLLLRVEVNPLRVGLILIKHGIFTFFTLGTPPLLAIALLLRLHLRIVQMLLDGGSTSTHISCGCVFRGLRSTAEDCI